MSEYTPTTSQIIEAFAWDDKYDELSIERIDMFWRWLSKIKEEVSTKAHFEHWLAEIKAQEAKAERERIMKLVQKQLEADPYNSVLRALEAGISQMPVKGEIE